LVDERRLTRFRMGRGVYTPAAFKESAEAVECKRVVKRSLCKERKRARQEIGGGYPHRDGKSAERIDSKGVEVCPLRKRVRKRLKREGLDENRC
jgi:hypothetical protein